jgi:hypothetical protein
MIQETALQIAKSLGHQTTREAYPLEQLARDWDFFEFPLRAEACREHQRYIDELEAKLKQLSGG